MPGLVDELNANQLKNIVHQSVMVEFTKHIEKMKSEGLTFIEAISEYCEINNIEPEEIVDYISPAMLKKITKEASQGNMIVKGSRTKDLDIFA